MLAFQIYPRLSALGWYSRPSPRAAICSSPRTNGGSGLKMPAGSSSDTADSWTAWTVLWLLRWPRPLSVLRTADWTRLRADSWFGEVYEYRRTFDSPGIEPCACRAQHHDSWCHRIDRCKYHRSVGARSRPVSD